MTLIGQYLENINTNKNNEEDPAERLRLMNLKRQQDLDENQGTWQSQLEKSRKMMGEADEESEGGNKKMDNQKLMRQNRTV